MFKTSNNHWGAPCVHLYVAGWHNDIQAAKTNLYRLQSLDIYESAEAAALATVDTVLDFELLVLHKDKFDKVFGENFNGKS